VNITQWDGNAVTGDGDWAELQGDVDLLNLTVQAMSITLSDVSTVADAIKLKTDNLPTEIKRNADFNAFPFAMYSSTDHVTKVASLSPAVYVAIDGGNFAAVAATPAERTLSGVPTGSYYVDLAAAELNGKSITLMITAAGADTLEINLTTTP